MAPGRSFVGDGSAPMCHAVLAGAMPDTKDARFARVAEAVVALLLRGGPDELRFVTLAREARVSRPWLYKYFGPDRDALLDFTVRTYGAAFAGVERSVVPYSPLIW